MPTSIVQEGRFEDPVDDMVDAYGAAASMAPLRRAGQLGTRREIEDEIDLIVEAMRLFAFKAPDQVLREVAAYGARLTEMAILLHRIESKDRQYMRIRTMQVGILQEELERQFKIASRLIEQMRLDLEASR